MVSPNRKGNPRDNTGRKQRTINNSKIINYPPFFGKYRFYIDVRSSSVKASLIHDLKAFGGTIEEFLSKDVTTVISDCPEYKFLGKSQVHEPPSPWAQTPSPATPNSHENTDRRKKTKSRVETILAAVRNPQRPGCADVLEIAKRFDCQRWALSKTLEWLKKCKLKCLENPQLLTEKPPPARNVHQLQTPYLKIESANKPGRPYYSHVKDWPALHLDGKVGSSPFSDAHLKQKKRGLAKRLEADRHSPPKAAAAANNKAANQQRKYSGYCEICNLNINDLDAHLRESCHRAHTGTKSYWAKVDAVTQSKELHPALQ